MNIVTPGSGPLAGGGRPPGGRIHVGFFGPGPGHGFPAGAFFAIVVLVVLIALAILVLRHEHWGHRQALGPVFEGSHGVVARSNPGAENEALRILNERFARGEVDPEDYKIRRDLLRGTD
jgi:uncharacterized membrane protein